MKLAILGASGHGKVVAETARRAGWDTILFFDDAWPGLTRNMHWPVVGNFAMLLEMQADFDGVVIAIGDNAIRLGKTRELLAAGATLATIIHPAAVVSEYSTLGAGSVVFAGAVIQADCKLGMACIVNTRASVDHDCMIGDGVHVCPGTTLAGLVMVGETSWIGIGSCTRQQVRIGARVTVGAGAAVINDIPDDATVAGVPARILHAGRHVQD